MTKGSRRRRSEPGARSLRKEGGSIWRPRTALPTTPSPAVEAHAGAVGGSRAPEVGPRGKPKAHGWKAIPRRQGGRRAALTEAGAGGVQLLREEAVIAEAL